METQVSAGMTVLAKTRDEEGEDKGKTLLRCPLYSWKGSLQNRSFSASPQDIPRVPICFGIFSRFVFGFCVLELAGAISLGSSVV